MSAKLMPAARTRMRISPAPGTGSGASRSSNTSGPPCRAMTACRIAVQSIALARFADPSALQVAVAEDLRCQQCEQRLLRVQAVLRLIEDDRGRRVDHLVGHLVAAMSWEAMHKNCLFGRARHQLRVHLVGPEKGIPSRGFALVAHRGPDIGVYRVRLRHSFNRIVGYADAAAESRDAADLFANGVGQLESSR